MAHPTSFRSPKIIRLLTRPGDRFALRVSRGPGAENGRGDVVLYHATAARRVWNNLALEFAIEQGRELRLPVVMIEGLDEPHLNERLASFIRQGSVINAARAADRGIAYVFDDFSIAERARIIVGDEFPTKRTVRVAPTYLVDGQAVSRVLSIPELARVAWAGKGLTVLGISAVNRGTAADFLAAAGEAFGVGPELLVKLGVGALVEEMDV